MTTVAAIVALRVFDSELVGVDLCMVQKFDLSNALIVAGLIQRAGVKRSSPPGE